MAAVAAVLSVAVRAVRAAASRLGREEAGEGVISAAIAVLVMAFIGAAMWVAFSGTFNRATQTIDTQVDRIGQQAPAPGPT